MHQLQQRLLQFSCNPNITPSKILKYDTSRAEPCLELREQFEKLHITGMIRGLPGYHRKMESCKPTNFLLYTIGDQGILDKATLAIVGPRRPSQYAIDTVEQLMKSLSGKPVTTVSGGAQGIDQLVLERSLEYGIPTIVVLGGGIGYYAQHTLRSRLQRVIQAGGLVVSQWKHYQEPTQYTFPQRNSVVACMGDFLFLPSAGVKSGSLITVDFAVDMHKVAYSVPTSNGLGYGDGTNAYIAQGKLQVVTDIDAYVQELFPEKHPSHRLTDPQLRLLETIRKHPSADVTWLGKYLSLQPQQLLMLLQELEMYGMIRESDPGRYSSND